MEQIEQELQNTQIKHREEIAEMNKENEEKVSLLLRQLRGVEIQSEFLTQDNHFSLLFILFCRC